MRGFIYWPLEILNIEPLQNSVLFWNDYLESLIMQIADFLVSLFSESLKFKYGRLLMPALAAVHGVHCDQYASNVKKKMKTDKLL